MEVASLLIRLIVEDRDALDVQDSSQVFSCLGYCRKQCTNSKIVYTSW